MFELRRSPGKGLGLFATKNIPKGCRILCEEPLVALPAGTQSTLSIWQQFDEMTVTQKAKYEQLTSGEGSRSHALESIICSRLADSVESEELDEAVANELRLRAIFNTNCVTMGTRSQWGVGVFEYYSRLNHSCTPNVFNSYNATIQKEVVHAIKPIAKGEELVTSYITNVRTAKQRQLELQRYGFTCKCEACYGPDARDHDRKRQRLFDLDQAFAVDAKSDSMFGSRSGGLPSTGSRRLFAKAKENVRLLEEEGLTGMEVAMGQVVSIPISFKRLTGSSSYRECSKYCLKLGDIDGALNFVEKERDIEISCQGPETDHMVGDDEFAFVRLKRLQQQKGASKAKRRQDKAHEAADDTQGGATRTEGTAATSDKNKKARLREKNRKIRKSIRDGATYCGYPLDKVQAVLDRISADQQANLAERLRGVEVGSWVQTFEREHEVLSRT